MRACHICGTECGDKEPCIECVAQFPHRRNADEMTGEERVHELDLLYGPLEVFFSMVHQRIEELVGRSVWTHELSVNKDRLFEEARTRGTQKSPLPSVEELIAPLQQMGKKVVFVVPPTDEGAGGQVFEVGGDGG